MTTVRKAAAGVDEFSNTEFLFLQKYLDIKEKHEMREGQTM